MASAACMKMAGVPVEFKVATTFEAIMALLPIPVIITLPFEARIQETAAANSSFKREFRLRIASLSVCIVFFAKSRIALVLLKVDYELKVEFYKECLIFKITNLRKVKFI